MSKHRKVKWVWFYLPICRFVFTSQDRQSQISFWLQLILLAFWAPLLIHLHHRIRIRSHAFLVSAIRNRSQQTHFWKRDKKRLKKTNNHECNLAKTNWLETMFAFFKDNDKYLPSLPCVRRIYETNFSEIITWTYETLEVFIPLRNDLHTTWFNNKELVSYGIFWENDFSFFDFNKL